MVAVLAWLRDERGRRRRATCATRDSRPGSSSGCACGSSSSSLSRLSAAAARPGAAGGDGVREALELVAERLELARAAARARARGRAASRRARDCGAAAGRAGTSRSPPPTRQPSKPEAPSFPWPASDASERRRARVEQRAAGVVLEARDRRRDAVAEVGLEQHVADQPPLAGDRLEREQARARHPRAVAAAVAAPEQLVAAADGEQRRAGLDGPPQVVASRREVGRDQRLLAILAAADVDEVERPRLERVAGLDRASPRARGPRRAARRAKTAMLPRSA